MKYRYFPHFFKMLLNFLIIYSCDCASFSDWPQIKMVFSFEVAVLDSLGDQKVEREKYCFGVGRFMGNLV